MAVVRDPGLDLRKGVLRNALPVDEIAIRLVAIGGMDHLHGLACCLVVGDSTSVAARIWVEAQCDPEFLIGGVGGAHIVSPCC